ncbi:MAG: hypothetical protein ACKVQR_19595 [Aquabacterium sp.]
MTSFRTRLLLAALTTLMLATAPGVATAAGTASPSHSTDLLARYRLDRADCNSGRSTQDLPTCLREAGAALAGGRRGGLDKRGADFTANALQRCDRLPGDDRRDCMARISGQGTTTGSAAGGGIYRELVVRDPAAAVPPAATASAPLTK